MVLCSGAFDGIHAGHVAYLNAAKMIAGEDNVLVAVAPDSYVRDAKQREPHWDQRQRLDAIQALRAVSIAFLQCHATPAEDIRRLRPDVFVKGIDWARALPHDVVAACREVGCLIVYVDTEGTHTSEARR